MAGALAHRARRGGHAWVFLQYLLGLRRLGWEVLFLDRLEAGMCTDDAGNACLPEVSADLRAFVQLLGCFGLAESFAVLLDGGGTIGLPRNEVCARVRSAAFLINVMGFLTDEEILGQARRRVFLDIDPGFGQMWCALGLHDLLRGHDDFVTVGANVGSPACAIPTCGREWIAIRPPIVLDEWPIQCEPGHSFTSVASWRGANGPVEYQGTTYGLRVHEFRKFATLPRRVPASFELALDIHPAETRDLQLLDANGWALADPVAAAGSPWAYRRYVQRSAAEFMVAKGMYVQANSGWFSDRSACYLASGRPVVIQDTGLAGHLPIGEGLLTFSTLDEASAALEAVAADRRRHARAARAIAEEYFDSNEVLTDLIGQLGAA
jgi:hypothetical protein